MTSLTISSFDTSKLDFEIGTTKQKRNGTGGESQSALNSELQRSFSFGAMRIQLHTYIPIWGTMNVEFFKCC